MITIERVETRKTLAGDLFTMPGQDVDFLNNINTVSETKGCSERTAEVIQNHCAYRLRQPSGILSK
jgi:hypothetical protein